MENVLYMQQNERVSHAFSPCPPQENKYYLCVSGRGFWETFHSLLLSEQHSVAFPYAVLLYLSLMLAPIFLWHHIGPWTLWHNPRESVSSSAHSRILRWEKRTTLRWWNEMKPSRGAMKREKIRAMVLAINSSLNLFVWRNRLITIFQALTCGCSLRRRVKRRW